MPTAADIDGYIFVSLITGLAALILACIYALVEAYLHRDK